MKRSVTIRLGAFASKALAGSHKNGTRPDSGAMPTSDDVVRAVRFYLKEGREGGPGWAYPGGLLEDRRTGEELELALSIEDWLWRNLEYEAERQHVSAGRLLEHAALYYAAELDAGRVTERILEKLD